MTNEYKAFYKINKLVEYIQNIQYKFEPITQRTPYFHMGATITDSILQAGLNYSNVVYPRILILLTKYKDYRTTCDFLILMQTVPLKDLINWKNQEKLMRIENLSWFLFDNSIENEVQLSNWLKSTINLEKLKKIKGVGPKTLDYLKMLSGNQAIAIDRHLFKFLEFAGILIKSYNEAHFIFSKSAELLDMSMYELDRKIWLYMSKASWKESY